MAVPSRAQGGRRPRAAVQATVCASAQYAYGTLHATDLGSIDAPDVSYLDPSVQAGGCGCDDGSCAPAARARRART
jgi:hypothetical protein